MENSPFDIKGLKEENQSPQYQDSLLNTLESDEDDNADKNYNNIEEETSGSSGQEKIPSKVQESETEKVLYIESEELTYTIKGEEFYIEIDDENIFLNHPKWSLVGVGKNLLEAEYDLLRDADLIYEDYFQTTNKDLSQEARNLKEFLYKIVV